MGGIVSSKKGKKPLNKKNRQESDNSDLNDDDVIIIAPDLAVPTRPMSTKQRVEFEHRVRRLSVGSHADSEFPRIASMKTPIGAHEATELIKMTEPEWDDKDAKDRFKEELGVMRTFFAWEEIPLDFFVDSFVGGNGQETRRRNSVQSNGGPPHLNGNLVGGNLPASLHASVVKPENPRRRAASVATPDVPTTPVVGGAQRRPPPIVSKPAAHAPTEDARLLAAAAPSSRPNSAQIAPPLSPIMPKAMVPPPMPARKDVRVRAASVAMGEKFPLTQAAAIQQAVVPPMGLGITAPPPRERFATAVAKANTRATEIHHEDHILMSSAAAPTGKNLVEQAKLHESVRKSSGSSRRGFGLDTPGDSSREIDSMLPMAHAVVERDEVQTPKRPSHAAAVAATPIASPVIRPSVVRNSVVEQVKGFQEPARRDSTSSRRESQSAGAGDSRVLQALEMDTRPRRPSQTNYDNVYGRLGKPSGHNDRFEIVNPVLDSSAYQPTRRPTLTTTGSAPSKLPEQYKAMASSVDPTQFATERRRTSVASKRISVPMAAPYVVGGDDDYAAVTTQPTSYTVNSAAAAPVVF